MLRPPLAHSAVTKEAAIWQCKQQFSTMLAYGRELQVYCARIVDMLRIEPSQHLMHGLFCRITLQIHPTCELLSRAN